MKIPGSRVRRALFRAGAVATGIVLMVVAAVALLYVDAVSTRVAKWLAGRLNPYPATRLTVERAELRWPARVTLRELALVPDQLGVPGGPELSVHLLDVRLSLRPLLSKTVQITEAELVGATVSVAQRADSTWDVTAPFRGGGDDTGQPGWRFRSGPIRVDDVRVDVGFAEPAPDSSPDRLSVEQLAAQIGGLAFGDGPPIVRIDSLFSRFIPPAPATGPVVVQGAVTLEGGHLSVPELTLMSASSDLTIRGSLLLPGPTHDDLEEIDFHIEAAPLSLRDVSGFLRTLDPSVELRGTATVLGEASRAEVQLHAEMSDGGIVDLEGTLAPLLPGLDGPRGGRDLQYGIRGTVEALRLESLVGAGPIAGHLTAAVDIDLRGSDRSRLGGAVDARLEGLQVGGWPLTHSAVSGTVTDGEADLELVGSVEGLAEASLHLAGRPLDPTPTLTVQGDLWQLEQGADRENPLATAGVEGLHARLEIALAGAPSLAALTGLKVEALAGEAFGRALAGGEAEVTWTGTTAVFRVAQPLGAGLLAASGTVENLWSGVRTLEGSANVRARNVAARDLVLDSVGLEAELNAGSLSAGLEAWATSLDPDAPAGGGHLTGRLSGRPLDDRPFLTLDTLAFSRADLLGLVPLRTSLTGAARARLDGFNLRTAALHAEVALDTSSVGPVRVETAELELALAAGRIDGRLEASSPAGAISAEGHALPFEPAPRAGLDDLRIRSLDLATLLAGGAPDTDLNLDVAVAGSGGSWDDLDATGQIDFLPSSVRSGTISGGRVILVATDGTVTAEGDLRSGTGRVRIDARVEGLERPTQAGVDLELDVDDLADFMGLDAALAATGTVGLTWRADSPLLFAASLGGRTPYGVVDTLVADGAISPSLFRLDSLLVSSEVVRVRGAGSLALEPEEAERERHELEFEFGVVGRAPSVSLPVLGPTSVASGQGRVSIGGAPEAREVSAALDVGPWRAARVSGVGLVARAEYGPSRFFLDLVAPSVVRGDTLKVAVGGRYDAAIGTGVLEQLDLSTVAGAWHLSSEVPYSLGDDLTIDHLELSSELGKINVDGTFSRTADHDLTVSLHDARLSWLTAALALEDLSLLANGELVLSGSAARPAADATVQLVVGRVNATPGIIRGELALEGGHASVDLRALDPSGEELRLNGTTPLGRPGDADPGGTPPHPVDLRLQASSFDVSWLGALVPRSLVDALEGRLQADVTASGDRDAPVITGDVTIESGSIHLAAAGPNLEDVRMVAAVRADEVRIQALEARSGPGTLRAQGRIGLDGFRPDALDLSAAFERFVGWSSASLTAVGTGDITVRGTFDEPLITGSVALDGSRLSLDEASTLAQTEAVELTEEDYRMLEDYFGYTVETEDVGGPGLLDRVGLQLSVRWDRDVWVTRFLAPRLSLESQGNLEVEKSPGGPVSATGTVEALPERSYFRQFGRRFSLDEGIVTLGGDPTLYTVSARARWEVPSRSDPNEAEVVVILEVAGDADGLRLTLSSDPEMDESDIVSYLATGTAPGVTTASDAGLGTAIALGAAAGALEGFAAEHVPLDVVEVATDPVRGTTLVAGRYFTPRLYLGFRQPVSFGQSSTSSRTEVDQSEAELEYQWFRWLTMNLQGGVSEFRFFFRSQHAY